MPEHTEPAPLDAEVDAIGALREPVRRSLYRYVVAQEGEVGRDEAAEAVDVQRSLAAFHLDKLVEAGLLEVTFRRLTGRTGPGAGRPAKLYRRSSVEHGITLPPRRYDLAAELLAEAVEGADDRPATESAMAVAARFGHRLGEGIRAALSSRAGRQRRLAALREALDRYGYEPRTEGNAVRLGNCPFHALAEGHRELMCGMNMSLLEGVLDGMSGTADLEARPDPEPGTCCVTLVQGTR